MTGQDAAYWSCEYCHAEQGEPCRSATGRRYLRVVHYSRREAVRLWQKYRIG